MSTLLSPVSHFCGPGIYELQRRIRIERPDLPVIFISAHNDDETRQRAFDEGAVSFLYKGELCRHSREFA